MFLGIEIGGTKLQLGLGAADGRLSGLWRGPVNPSAGAAGIRDQIRAGLPRLFTGSGIAPRQLKAAGVGFGGPTDDASQTVIRSHQVSGWDGFPLAAWLADLLGVPAVLGNDADVAALAEAQFGAGRGLSPVFYVTVGSGIGGGLVIDGRIHRGCGRGAAEIGQVRVPGRDGTWRPLAKEASGWAIEQAARERLGLTLTAKDVGERAGAGDPLAREVLTHSLTCLAEAVCHVIALVCPRRVVIGGGVSLLGEDLFFSPLRRLVVERVFPPFAGCFQIVPASLGEEVVVHGAIELARQRHEQAREPRHP